MIGHHNEDRQPFQVDLSGIVDLLSKHIYSSPRIYLRELLQNGRDAIVARAELEGADPSRGIRISPISADCDTFVLSDDGIGLSATEMAEMLSTVGRSSKRDIFDMPRSDYLGQFGIGLLSCFMVADHIVIRSRSARGDRPVEWSGHADGTFSVRELDDDLPIGTTVHLTPRFDRAELLGTAVVLELAATFGEFLPVSVQVDLPAGGAERVTRIPTFLEDSEHPSAELLSYGRNLIGAEPFDVIPLTVGATGTRGTAFVLPFSPPPGARQANRLYLGRMLLGERVEGLLPDWAFFVRAVVDSTGLSPTASRESLVDDEQLEHTRAQLGDALRRWVIELGIKTPHRLNDFVTIHQLALKSLVLHDAELAGFITRFLSVETSIGWLRIDSLVRVHTDLRYAETVEEFRQIASIARPERPVINGGYVYDSAIARLLPSVFESVTMERVSVIDELDQLASPGLADRHIVAGLEDRASAVLAELECAVVVRTIDQHDLTGLYVSDPELLRSVDRRRAQGVSGGVWGRVLSSVDAARTQQRNDAGRDTPTARLCLNWSNPLVATLARLEDETVFSRTVNLLYVQALLAGHRPLGVRDRALMTSSLADLITLSVGFDYPQQEEAP